MQEARVHAYSAAADNCHSADTDFGVVNTGDDGSFRIGLRAYDFRDSVCVFAFAHPPLGALGLEDSDTALLMMDFRDIGTLDSARSSSSCGLGSEAREGSSLTSKCS